MSSAFGRRDFACYLLAGTTGLTASPVLGGSDVATDAPELGSYAGPELLLELVRRIDPDRLKEEHLNQLRGDLELNLQRSKVLSAFALTNADEPAPVFAAWRSEG